MALPPIATPLSAPQPASRVDDARAAFFRQALTQAAPPAAAPVPTPAAALAQPTTATPVRAASAPDPDRPMRPGSILDIRV